MAVRAKVPLQEYLTWRLGHYQGQAPQSRHPLPYQVSVDDSEVHRMPDSDAEKHPWQRILEEPASEDSFQAALGQATRLLNRSESQALLRELQQYEEEAARLTERLMAVNESLEDQAVERQQEIAEGSSPVPATLARPPEDRGRPRLPLPWKLLLGYLAIAGMIGVEAFQFAIPYLNAIGVDVSNLAAEWGRNKVGILMGSGFALATSAGIFILWHRVFQGIRVIFMNSGPEPWWKIALKAAYPLVLVGLLIAAAWGIGKMRGGASKDAGDFLGTLHGQTTAANGGDGVFVLLTILVPLAAACLQHRLGGIIAQRQQVTEEQKQWDLAEHQALLVRERRAELIRQIEEERSRIEQRHQEARDRIRALAERAQAAERLIREGLEAERRSAVIWANSLLAALEQDRYYFLKAARKARAAYLVNGFSPGFALHPKESQAFFAGLSRVQGGNGQSQP